jgi:hypothetical protein
MCCSSMVAQVAIAFFRSPRRSGSGRPLGGWILSEAHDRGALSPFDRVRPMGAILLFPKSARF